MTGRNKSRTKMILMRQVKLTDKIDHNAEMGYLPSENDIAQLKKYERETGIIIRNPTKEGTINSSCPEGYEFVSSYHKSDGTFIRSFCRKRNNDIEIPYSYRYGRKM